MWKFYCEKGSKERECREFSPTPPLQDFLEQILRGVDWMHMNNIVHRDLKPQNILVSSNGKKIKIADFGLSRLIGSNVVLSTQVGTMLISIGSQYYPVCCMRYAVLPCMLHEL